MATATVSKKKTDTKVETNDEEVEKTGSIVASMLFGMWFLAYWSVVVPYRTAVKLVGVQSDPIEPEVKTTYWQYLATTLFVASMLVLIGYCGPWQYGLFAVSLLVLLLEIPYLAALTADFKSKASKRMVVKGVVLSCLMFGLGIVTVSYPVALGVGTVFWLSWLTLDKLLGVNVANKALYIEEEAEAKSDV